MKYDPKKFKETLKTYVPSSKPLTFVEQLKKFATKKSK